MAEFHDRMLPAIFRLGVFDPDWYRAAYPDVDMVGLRPDIHYRRYGYAMRRLPNGQVGDWCRMRLDLHPAPLPNAVLLEAARIGEMDGPETGVAYAERHFTPDMSYSIDTLRANAALRRGDEAGWLDHLNAYIAHFNAAPLTLGPGPRLLDRLRVTPLPQVTGGPLVSVIMPTWNAEGLIEQTVRSVLDQTWTNLELLVVDDASTDGTWAVLQGLAATDSRLNILRNRVNVGPYVAKNTALRMARGDWITGQDADDWAHPQWLEHHMKAVLGAPVPPRVSVPLKLRIAADGTLVRFMTLQKNVYDGAARVSQVSALFRSDFLRDDLGSWDCIRFGADSEMVERATLLIGAEFATLPILSILGMDLETSLTNSPVFGISKTHGLSEPRRSYRTAYQAFHKSLAKGGRAQLRLAFPPSSETPRLFPAPPGAIVPLADILENQKILPQTPHG